MVRHVVEGRKIMVAGRSDVLTDVVQVSSVEDSTCSEVPCTYIDLEAFLSIFQPYLLRDTQSNCMSDMIRGPS